MLHHEDDLDINDKLVLDKFVEALIANRAYSVMLEPVGSAGKSGKDLNKFLKKVQQYLLEHWVEGRQIQVMAHRQMKSLKLEKKSLVTMKISP